MRNMQVSMYAGSIGIIIGVVDVDGRQGTKIHPVSKSATSHSVGFWRLQMGNFIVLMRKHISGWI